METNARYALIGMFTLAVILAGFSFVFWLNNSGGFGQRDIYQVKFSGSVSDLLVGSHVLFNGIRVGEVASLRIDSENPSQVLVTVEVENSTPMRTDTSVSMDFQGLTGAPVITLTGGSPTAPPLVSENGEPPLLIAPPDSGHSLTQSARATLKHVDTILSENQKPLNEAIEAISTFSKALARNADRVDGIVAGIERFTGGAGSKGKATLYDLGSASHLKACKDPKYGNILVPEPTAPMALNSDKILVVGDDPDAASFDQAQWLDNVPALVQARIIQSLENTGCYRSVSRPVDAITPDHTLSLEIRNFSIAISTEPKADIEISAKLIAGDEQAVESRVFQQTDSLKSADSSSAVTTFQNGFETLARELVLWVNAKTAAVVPSEQ